MDKLVIVKIGGKILEESKQFDSFVAEFIKIENPKILVHGGGRDATSLMNSMGVKSKYINGRRITDAATLKIVTMSYAGWTNKTLVTKLNALGCVSVGLSGADGNFIVSEKRKVKDIDYGFAGDILEVNKDLIVRLLNGNYVPTICAITHDANGQLLNTNADTIAASVAIALSEIYTVSLRYCFEFSGVLRDDQDATSVIEKIDDSIKDQLVLSKIISGGMLPKVNNALNAKKSGVNEVSICGIEELNTLKFATRFYE